MLKSTLAAMAAVFAISAFSPAMAGENAEMANTAAIAARVDLSMEIP